MGYLHIQNLYRQEAQVIFLFKEVFCLEKIHGCLRADSLINMADGSLRPIKDVKPKDKVKSFDEKTKKIVEAEVTSVVIQEKSDLLDWFCLEFDGGRKIVCTEDHPVLTNKGWVQSKDLTDSYEIIHILGISMKLLNKTKLSEKFVRFDLSVKGTHNFFCNGICVHNTSAHLSFNPADGSIRYFSGGETHARFVQLFNEDSLIAAFKAMALPADKSITVFGEAYGGKQQGMSATYGKDLKFIAFDVKIGECWLDVPTAEKIVLALGLEFVWYTKSTTDLKELNMLRDLPSMQSVRNGVTAYEDFVLSKGKPREGIVIRPLQEMRLNNGDRVIAKHKGDAFRETATVRKVELDPSKIEKMANAEAVANEYVTQMRLSHVLSKIPDHDISKMPQILDSMLEDVLREGAGEIDLSDEARIKKAIKSKCAVMYKACLEGKIATV